MLMPSPVRPAGPDRKASPRAKIPWRRVDGVLLLDKPVGMTSNDALQKARRLFLAEKGGHTGTLDPLASGLLPLCFGEATKFAHDLLDADKTYEATVRFGIRTETGDADGRITDERPVTCTADDLAVVIEQFRGEIDQIPPMHSALKKDGVPLYKLARQGKSVERAARRVRIHSLDWLRIDLPEAVLRVSCSKGTYIRTLAEDIGAALGCGAHLTALRRTRVGSLNLADAVPLDTLREVVTNASEVDAAKGWLRAVDSLVRELPAVRLEEGVETTLRFLNGNAVALALPEGERYRVYAGDRFVGVALRDARGLLQPQRLVRP